MNTYVHRVCMSVSVVFCTLNKIFFNFPYSATPFSVSIDSFGNIAITLSCLGV